MMEFIERTDDTCFFYTNFISTLLLKYPKREFIERTDDFLFLHKFYLFFKHKYLKREFIEGTEDLLFLHKFHLLITVYINTLKMAFIDRTDDLLFNTLSYLGYSI